ncbi:hypothetical protein HPP92_025847 [Vanilla planifolia]|uniref:Pentatricopeptide repeat-containing protein n=1 Tax=Vanilla planifolia TaxID=51239 RepID=A0A835PE69_VANPL|nr:hypothetical protein HPP92_025847 [Vanilla planifolia]
MFLCRKLKPFNNCYFGNAKSFLFFCDVWNKTSSSSSTTASNPVCIPFSSAISAVLMESGDSLFESLPAAHTSLLVAQTLTNLKRKPEIALAIFRCFQEQGFRHDIFTCSVIIRILCDSGQRKKLVSLLSEMLSSNEYLSFDLPALFDVLYQGNSSFDSLPLLFDSIIKAYASCNRGGLAVEAFFELTKAGYRPSLKSCNFLMNLMAQGSDIEMVMAVYHCMKRFKIDPSVHTYTILIKATCSSGNLERASNILEEMVQAGVTPDLMAYTTFIGALCECGKPDVAFDFLKIIRNQGVNSLAYNKVISAFCKQTRLEEAEKVLETMLQQDVMPDTFSYNCLIKVLCAKGNLLKAAYLLKEMESAGIPHDRFTATFIVQGFCKFEQICDALQHFKKFKDSAMFLDGAAYNAAMCAWCKIGEMERAMDLFQEMIDQGLFPDKMHFTTLIYGYCCIGKIDSAQNLLMQMLNAKLEPDLVTYNVLASGICRNGSFNQEAHDLLELMWERGVAPNATTYGIFIEGLCRQGSLEEAEILFKELEGRGLPKIHQSSVPWFLVILNMATLKRPVSFLSDWLSKVLLSLGSLSLNL